jgi:hypothetical protein
MEEQSKSESYLNIATVLSIGSIVMYILGWTYWKFYFQTLNISLSLVDLSFDKIIVSTWSLLFFVILGFVSTFLQTIGSKDDAWDVITVIFVLCMSVNTSIYSIIEFDYHIFILILLIVIYVPTQIILRQNKIEVTSIKIKNIRYIIITLILVFGLFYYGYGGKKDAEKLLNSYEENCELILKSDEIIYGQFITKAEKRLFIVIETIDCKKKILMINEDEIVKIFIPTK